MIYKRQTYTALYSNGVQITVEEGECGSCINFTHNTQEQGRCTEIEDRFQEDRYIDTPGCPMWRLHPGLTGYKGIIVKYKCESSNVIITCGAKCPYLSKTSRQVSRSNPRKYFPCKHPDATSLFACGFETLGVYGSLCPLKNFAMPEIKKAKSPEDQSPPDTNEGEH